MYKKISRESIPIQGYLPRFNIPEGETRKEYIPRIVSSPIIEDDNEDEVVEEPVKVIDIPFVSPTYKTSKTKFTGKSDYVATMLPIYERLLKNHGINPGYAKALVAQDGLESAWGTKPTGRNNFGGIKDFRPNMGSSVMTTEFENGKYVPKKQPFRDFASLDDYAEFKIRLLAGNKYNAFTGDFAQFAERVKRGGYATDPNYVQKLNNVIRSVKNGGIIKAQQGLAELKPDNRNWIQKQVDNLITKYRNSSWANSAPAEVLAMTIPYYGVPHYLLGTKDHDSDPALAAMSVLPTTVIVKDGSTVAKAATKGVKSVYDHYKDLDKYSNGVLKHLWNTSKTYNTAEMAKVPKTISSVQSTSKLGHEYAFFTDSTGDTILNISSTATDPFYAGQKAAGKQLLQKFVFSTSDDAIRPFTLNQQRLLTPRYLPKQTIPMSEKDAISRLMVYKTNGNITSSFENLSEQEAKKLFDIAYEDNFFARGNYAELSNAEAKEQYWTKYKNDIIDLFKKVPVLAGVAIGADAIAQNPGNYVEKDSFKGDEKYDYYHNPFYDAKTQHWGSRDPKTGLELKAPDHPTHYMAEEADKSEGLFRWQDYNGRYYTSYTPPIGTFPAKWESDKN